LLDGFALQVTGVANISAVTCRLDDGDGIYAAGNDTEVWLGTPGQPNTNVSLGVPITIAGGSFADLWIVLAFSAGAGSSLGESYTVALGPTIDISSSASSVIVLGQPQSSPVNLIEFSATVVGMCTGLSIRGSGLTPPFTLTIDGVTKSFAMYAGQPQDSHGAHGRIGWGYEGPGYWIAEDHSRIDLWPVANGWPDWPARTQLYVEFVAATGFQANGGFLYRSCSTGYAGDASVPGLAGCAAPETPDGSLPWFAVLSILCAVVVAFRLTR
jgi:hypothetical protein